MKSIMKIIPAIAAAAMTIVTGCKSLPSADKMKSSATSIGAAAGYVANLTKISDKARVTVIAITEKVAQVTPKEGQSFADAWTPVAQELVEKYVAEGKITKNAGKVALAAFGVAVKGIDYLFDVRFPKARQYEELVAAAVSGFTDGFLSVFTPPNGAKPAAIEPDAEAVEWLQLHVKGKARLSPSVTR